MTTRATPSILALAALLVAVAPSFAAEESALQIPAQDDTIVEHLPTHVGDAAQRRAARAAERAQRTALQRHPDELGPALQAAQPFLAGFPYLNTPIPGTGARAEPSPSATTRGNGSK